MKTKRDENGLVAILVATMIMIIMSLVVLGFAHLMQREQRAALDKSLSTQAFYAAETGINDAVQALHSGGLADRVDCDPGAAGTISTGLSASYSCLLIDNTPSTLEYTAKAVTTTESKIVPIRAAGGTTISRMEISWDQDATSTAFRGCPAGTLPAIGSWGGSPGMLRIDVIPAAGALTRAGLISTAMNAYLYPVSSGGGCGVSSVSYGAGYIGNNAGRIVPVSCANGAAPHQCVISINSINTTSMYLRMKSIYDGSNVTIRIFDASNAQLQIEGAQVVVDSTGRVGDVVRRLQVRVPTKATYDIPDSALETTLSICKQLAVVPNVSATSSTACSTY